MRFSLIILFVLLIFSCSEDVKGFEEPADLIPRDSMVLILKDLTLVESHIQNEYLSVDQYQQTMLLSGDEVLKKYGISRDRLNRNMDYYGSHQNELVKIYTEILDSLNKDARMYDPSKLNSEDTLSLIGQGIRKVPFLGRPGK